MSSYLVRGPSFTILKGIAALAFDRPISVQLTTSLAIMMRPRFLRHPYNKPQQARLAEQSIETYARAVRAFFGYLHREEMIDHNPMSKVKMPRVPKKVVPTFSGREVERLLSHSLNPGERV